MKVNIHTHNPKTDEITLRTIGIHPYDAEGANTDALFAVEREAAEFDAIGEIGLDFVCSADREQQILLFKIQLEIAQKLGKGVIIHCVRAFEQVMDILKNYDLCFVIFHGFIGSKEQAARAVKRGYYLSFGERTFRSPKSIEAMITTDHSHLFFETDQSNTTIEQIYSKAASLLGIPEPLLEYITNENFNKICG